MIKVLHKTATLGAGGIQKFLIGVHENIDLSIVQFDYFLNTTEKQFYTERVKELGGKIYGPKKNTGNYFLRFFKRYYKMYNIIKTQNYNIIHISENISMTACSTIVAKLAGADNIIVHSHNDHSNDKENLFKRFHSKICSYIISRYGTHFLSCSDQASKWMFTNNIYANNKPLVVKNGIDAREYIYNVEMREKYRKKLNIEDKFVIGHIGRFNIQKNHQFIIEVFNEIHKKNEDSILLLVGQGELEEKIRNQIKEYNLENCVIMYGVTDKVNKLIQAMDVFIFPSIFEGLGIVAIEAQAAAIQTICSESVPEEVNVTQYCQYISLSESAKLWAQEIEKYRYGYDKSNTYELIRKSGFDIYDVSKQLEKYYMNMK